MSDYQKIKTIPSFNISLYKRDSRISPNIYYYFSHGKKVYRGSTGTSDPVEGERISIEKYLDIKRNKGQVKPVKFEFVVQRFLKHKESELSSKTYSEYVRQSRYLVERFKGKDIHTFTRGDYKDYELWRRDYYSQHPRKRLQKYTGRGGQTIKGCRYRNVGNPIINREVGLLVSILRHSQEELGYLKGQIIPSWSKLEEKTRNENDLLTQEHYLTLKRGLESKWVDPNKRKEERKEKSKKRKQTDRFLLDVIQFVLGTGLRFPSELFRLTFRDINFEGQFILVRDTKGHPPKTRVVPVIENTTPYRVLKKMEKRWFTINGKKKITGKEKPNPEDYVFVDGRGRRVKNLRKSFKRRLQEYGLPENVTMYSFRHSYTVRGLTEMNLNPKVLSELLGHVDGRMIDKHYGHLTSQHLIQSVTHGWNRNNNIPSPKQKKDSE